jgi:hypothetical protein
LPRNDAIDANDAADKTENADPTHPIERNEPAEPMESTELREPMESSDRFDYSDHFEVSSRVCMVLGYQLSFTPGRKTRTALARPRDLLAHSSPCMSDTTGHRRSGLQRPKRSKDRLAALIASVAAQKFGAERRAALAGEPMS